MKIVSKILTAGLIVLSSVMAGSCTDGFEAMNTNPGTLALVRPEELFYRAQTNYMLSDHAWNSIYYSKFQWMQYGTPHTWFAAESNMNTRWTYHTAAIGNTIYDEYNSMGGLITTIEYLAGKTCAPEMYSDLLQMGRILLIAKAIQTSDLFGSLVYSDGWLSRKGLIDDESMMPAFETQEQLVAIWDSQLKECIRNLQAGLSATGKVSLGGIDRSYNGDPQKWIKAANAVRLRLASRIWKIQPEKARAIAAEVLAAANAANVFDTREDSFILWYDNLFTTIPDQQGDWHSVEDLNRASATLMDYLNKYEDPRKPVYFRINNLTPENVAEFNRQQKEGNPGKNVQPYRNPHRLIPAYYGRWEGATMSFDRRLMPTAPVEPGPDDDPPPAPRPGDPPSLPPLPNPKNFADGNDCKAAMDAYYDNFDFDIFNRIYYDRRYLRVTFAFPNTSTVIDMLPANTPQTRLWKGDWDEGTTGGNWAPVMTCADFCYLAAEFVLCDNIVGSRTARQWYEAGLRASLEQWNDAGKFCDVHDYEPMTEAAIENFLNKPDILWDDTKALEQIHAQTWVEHYKNVDEAYAFWKRTGYPGKTSKIVIYEPVMVNGTERTVPRRVKFTYPGEGVHNYENLKKRLDDMAKDPKFGDINDEFGRLWWDVE